MPQFLRRVPNEALPLNYAAAPSLDGNFLAKSIPHALDQGRLPLYVKAEIMR